VRRLAPALLAALLLVLAFSCAESRPSGRLFAFRYGISTNSESAIFAGASGDVELPFHWLFYLWEEEGRLILIDCGFDDPAKAEEYGIWTADPLALLKKAGFSPSEIDDVVITHAHFDHIGLLSSFPRARVWIQREALARAENDELAPDLGAFLRGNRRLRVFSGSIQVSRRLSAEYVGGHTAGSSVVWISRGGARLLLPGDEAYYVANVLRGLPSGSTGDPKRNAAFLLRTARMRSLRVGGVFTFHDPGILPEGGPSWAVVWPVAKAVKPATKRP